MQTLKVSDDELIQMYLKGNVRSFETLLRRHKNAAYAVILNKVKSRDVADEIFQNVFIKIIEVFTNGNYKPQNKFKPYLLRLCVNFSIDYLRKKNTKKEHVFSYFMGNNLADDSNPMIDKFIDRTAIGIVEKMEMEREAALIRKLILQLPQQQQEVIILKQWGNLKFREIAEQVGENINTVQARFRYGLKKLKVLLKQHQIEITFN